MKTIFRILLIHLVSGASLLSAQTLQFATNLGSSNSEQLNGISTNSGKVYACGSYINGSAAPAQTDFDPGPGTVNGPGSVNIDQFWCGTYDANGAYSKVFTVFNNSISKSGRAISADVSGNYAVTGATAGTGYYGGGFTGPVTASGALYDIVVARYDVFNNWQWSFKIGGTAVADEGLGIATDNSGNVYVTGYFQGAGVDFDPGAGVTALSSAGTLDIFVAKYNAGGVFQWAIPISGTTSEKGTGIAVDASGNVYVTGVFTGTVDFDPTAGTANLTESGSGDVFVAKYNTNGVYQWAIAMGGAVGDQGNAIATDGTNVYVTGFCQGFVDFDPGAGVLNYTGAGGQDIFVGKYSAANGALVWCRFMSGSGNEQGTGISVDASGNVFYSGFFASTVDFDPGAATVSRTSAGGDDIIFSKFNSSGTLQWASQIGGTGTDRANAIATDASGFIYLGGYFQGAAVDFDVTAGTVALTSNGMNDLFFAKYSESVCTPASISTNPANATICVGANTSMSVTAGGTGPLNYQWQKNSVNMVNGGNITGANSATLNISTATAGDAGNYRCVVTGACAPSTTSTAAVLTVNAATTITTQPSGLTLCAGANANFSIAATGSGLSYQWQKNGSNISNGGTVSGATSANLQITGVVTADAANYACVVTGSCGNATSATVALAVNAAPSIGTQPTSQTICTGQTLNLSVVATGAGLTYQWRKGALSMTNGGSVSGATSANLTITSVVAGDAASYTCVVSGTCTPSVTSSAAVITVGTSASITTQPVSSATCVGSTATFNVVATGSGFQWQKGGVPLSNGGNVSGATSATLTITGVAAPDAGSYTCVITGCPSNVTSSAATLTVNSLPSITTQPVDQGVCVGDAGTFTVVATGTGPLTYQWRKAGVPMSDGGNISGSSTATLTISSSVLSDGAAYTVVVGGLCTPTVTSSTATLYVGPPPVITSQPSSVTVCSGQTATFTITAPGAGSYQWRKGGVNLSNGGNISGATTATLTISSVSATDADDYTCVVVGCAVSATSNIATLTIGSALTISTQPADVTICAGNDASFNVVVTGTGLTYQWKKDGTALTDGGSISGATTASLSVSAAGLSDAAGYSCAVTSSCGTVNSNAGQLFVDVAPAITADPASQSICTGNNLTLTVAAVGTSMTYQWKFNGTSLTDGGAISGSATSNLTLTNATIAEAGNYTCEVSGTCAPMATSAVAVITVTSAPSITTQPLSQSGCTGTSVSMSVVATGAGLTYVWKKGSTTLTDGGTISGATTATLTISSLVASDAGNYTCELSSSCGTNLTSAVAVLTVGSSSASINGQPVNATVCLGQNAAFFCNVSGSGITFQWQKNGVDLINGGNISGATSFALQVAGVSSADIASYRCLVSSGSCSTPIISNTASLIIASPMILVQPFASSVCSGSLASFDVIASGSNLTYQWKLNGTNVSNGAGITGATTNALRINNVNATHVGTYTCLISSSVCPPPATSTAVTLSVSACTPTVAAAEDAQILVYPNPNGGQFHVKVIDHPTEATYLSVYNMMGEKVWEQVVAVEQEMNLETLPAGIYQVKATQGDMTYQTKVVISK